MASYLFFLQVGGKLRKMGSIASSKAVLLFILIILASLLSTSSAGRTRKFVNWPTGEITAAAKEMPSGSFRGGEDAVHERMLKVKTNDYGSYDPSPAFDKPPFKLIPN